LRLVLSSSRDQVLPFSSRGHIVRRIELKTSIIRLDKNLVFSNLRMKRGLQDHTAIVTKVDQGVLIPIEVVAESDCGVATLKVLDGMIPIPASVLVAGNHHWHPFGLGHNQDSVTLDRRSERGVVIVAQSVEKARATMEPNNSSSDKLDTLVRMLESQKPQASRILLKSGGRLILVSQRDICYASIEDGIITVVTGGPNGMEGQSNCRTLEELLDSLDPNLFWRAHRSFLVNVNRIKEVVPWFKSSYQLRMDDKKQTEVPVSRAQTKRLRELFGL